MTVISFDAQAVSGRDPHAGLLLVGFYDDPISPSRYLLLQRSVEPDDQDKTLGHDTYHVEWCEQGQSIYGGIEEFILAADTARVRFTLQAARVLGSLTELTIKIKLLPGEFEALSGDLKVIFAGTGCDVRANA